MEMMIELPGYTESLVQEMEKHDFLVHSFPLNEDQSVYFPGDYLYNKSINQLSYVLVLDTNIFHFLLRASEGIYNEKTRAAAGLVSFCKTAEIDIDPAIACYELINYDPTRADEAVRKLLLFDKINNSDERELAEFCFGDRNSFSLPQIPERDSEEIKTKLTEYRRLKEWDSVYLLVLAIVHFDQSSLHKDHKFEAFIEWMFSKFHLSVAAGAFCAIYFGTNSSRNMMKYKASDTVEKRKSGLANMTWDLFIIQQYFRQWIGNGSNLNYLYASDDTAFKAILRLGIDIQISKDVTPMRPYLKEKVYNSIERLYSTVPADSEREYYKTEEPVGKYRDTLINEFESTLGIKIS